MILCFFVNFLHQRLIIHLINELLSLLCLYTVCQLGRRLLIWKAETRILHVTLSSELWDGKWAFNSRSCPSKEKLNMEYKTAYPLYANQFFKWNPWYLCITLKEELYILFLEVPAGDEPGQWLMLPLPLPVRLPPVGIVRADHMENVALHEGDAQLSTGNVYVLLWIVVKQGFYMNLGTKENKTLSKYKSCCVLNEAEIGIKFWAW